MSIYVVGSTKNLFPELDNPMREKFLVDVKHDGDNIDHLNPWYCELTALYYLWKNSTSSLVGLEHYRRFFASKNMKGNQNMRLGDEEAKEILKTHDIIMCNFRHKPYYSAYDWFVRDYGKEEDLMIFVNCLNDTEPYLGDKFISYLKRRELKQCNMFIAHKPVIDKYCEWIFPKLALYDRAAGLTEANKRIDGYFSEHIFGLWAELAKLNVYVCKKVEMHFIEASGSKV